MDLLMQIKTSMRIAHEALDAAIQTDIQAGAQDLLRVGVRPFSDDGALREEPLIWKALELYCKAQADYQGKGADYETSYTRLRDAMSLCGDYR